MSSLEWIYLADNMSYKLLTIWVEGIDDQRLVEKIMRLKPPSKFHHVSIQPYACHREKKDYFSKYLRTINKVKGYDYLFISDIDESPCVTQRKQKVIRLYSCLDPGRMAIVIREIESWYYAGLSNQDCKELKLPVLRDTNNMTKEEFFRHRPKNFDTDLQFLLELRGRFKLEQAIEKNSSFRYFAKKYLNHI